ncbi:MAG TPA: Gfo/Idh/MocA family oxidoreductase [Solirubrobacteraceae bacterium]|nr:Gfo/Idh/MocA family oxidoreductase [Solirubrobacteraceae bacterium]
MTPLRVGVVGVGWAGQQHLDAYARIPGVEIAAIAGLELDQRAELQARYDVRHAVDGWEELLALGGLDAVSIAVPTFLHAPIATAALERGVHVLSEKPIARTLDEAQAMVRAAQDAGRVLDVVFNHRRRGDIQTLKGMIDEGRLGRPYYAKAFWMRRSGIPTMGSWFTRSQLAGGGPLMDIGVHVLDYALFLLGTPAVATVSASTYDLLGQAGFGSSASSDKTGDDGSGAFDVEDLATVFVRLEDGGTLLLEASWAAHRTEGDEFGITLFGTGGGAHLNVFDYAPRGDLHVYGDEGGRPIAAQVPVEPGPGHRAVVADFVATVRSGDWEGHDGSAAAELARIIDACYRSAAERREIALEPAPARPA